MNRNSAIGIFDSGLGGLTVVEQVRRKLPRESVVYFGDTARVPYGTKSRGTVQKFSLQIARFLLRFGTKMILVACNTSSAQALPLLRKKFPGLCILGVIDPAAKYAALCGAGNIGIIGTEGTIRSGAYEKLIKKYNGKPRVLPRACPLFVPLVEEGWFDSHSGIVSRIAAEYIGPLKKKKMDALILGCTHYPLLRGIIGKVSGSGTEIIDSAEYAAAETARLLEENDMLSDSARPAYRYFVSDEPKKFVFLARRFMKVRDSIKPSLANTKKVNIEKY
jgi:glutamate racemase